MLQRQQALGQQVAGQKVNRFRIAAKTLITFRRLGLNAKAIAEGEDPSPN